MTNTPITIALVEPQAILRCFLAGYLKGRENLFVVCECANGNELIEYIKNNSAPDITVLELNMPILCGHKTTQWLQKNHPATKVIILTMANLQYMMAHLQKAGVKGFVNKDSSPTDLKTAIDVIMNGGEYYCAKNLRWFQSDRYKQKYFQKENLSEQELTFLQNVSSELTYKEIAVKMSTSNRSIEFLRMQLFQKLMVKSRTALSMTALLNGIGDLVL